MRREPIGVRGCLVLAAVWGMLALPGSALAAKPECGDGVCQGNEQKTCPEDCGGGDGGNGGGKTPVCISFLDLPGHRIQSDLVLPYCDDKKLKTSAFIGQGGHLRADFNITEKEFVGRSLWIDFGETVTINGESPGGLTFSSTDDLDEQGIWHDASFGLGVFRDDIDLRALAVGDARHDVNLRAALFIHPPEANEFGLFIRFEPDDINLQRSCHAPGSAYVTVSCIAEDAHGCNTWFIDATHADTNGNGAVDPGERSMACVELSGGGGGPYALYSLPFTATVTIE